MCILLKSFLFALRVSSWLSRVKFPVYDHGFTDCASAAKAVRLVWICVGWKSSQQALEFLVEQLRDELRRMLHGLALLVLHRDQIPMKHALRNHQPIDAVGG